MTDKVIKFRPMGAPDKVRVEAAVWSDAPGVGRRWVIPVDGSPRRYVLVRQVKGVWVEEAG